jgi:hypothetical protein
LPPFHNLDYYPPIFGMFNTNHFCIYPLFLIGWSSYSFGGNNTCWNWHFPIPNGVTRYIGHVTLSCLLSGPTLWKPSGLILSTIIGFFGGSPTRAKVYYASNRCYFRYHVRMYLLICGYKGKCLVISSSYHTFILSICNHYYILCLFAKGQTKNLKGLWSKNKKLERFAKQK